MALLDQLLGAAKQTLSGSQSSDLGQSLFEMVGTQMGGVQGLADLFQQKGLGNVVQSWIGTGPNQAITADQLVSVLGQDRIAQLAGRVGLAPDQAQQIIAQVLPGLIDHLTPNGQIPQQIEL
ncbi:MAG TPA: YidB family protein, partial [Candidatus Acidoferrales bacterium]|nr:YidB family protein [Candidatus Acidoferrales bacterium]